MLTGEVTVADSMAALEVLETSHPPTIYVPPADVNFGLLAPSKRRGSWCEFKGAARYLDLVSADGSLVPEVGWSYPDPTPAYAALRDHVAFYPGRVDAAWLDEELITAQAGDFYGGWISADLKGPFKGPPGTLGW